MQSVLALCVLAATTFGIAPGQNPAGQQAPPFVSADWLARRLNDPSLVLFHIGAKDEYPAAHIPGAQFLALDEISTRGPDLSLEMPPAEALKAAFEGKGVSDGSTVVVYFGKDWVTPTARVYVTLDYLGLGDRTFILDGGLPAWRAAGHPVTAEVPEVKPGSINPKPRPEIIVKTAWLADHLRDPGLLLIDARNTEFYEGKEKGSGARAGHIPGAVSIPFNTVVDDSNKIKDRAELQKLFPPGATPQTASPVTYCHVGQQASLLYVVAKFLGYSPRLYDESFQVWSRQPDLPVDAPAAKKVS